MENKIIEAFLQYGAIGLVLAYMLWKDWKKDDKTNQILDDLKVIFLGVITHERDMNSKERNEKKECYDKIYAKIEDNHKEVIENVCDIGAKIDIHIENLRHKG